jgi:predicted nucleic acid-binding protein
VIVVDTNVASEIMRPSPASAVADWISARQGKELCTTSVTLAEIRYGVERLPKGRRQDRLEQIVEEVFATFEGGILAFDASAAAHFGTIVARRDRAGLPIEGFDAQVASICRAHGLALATRNVTDFQHTGIIVVDPWQSV